MNGNHRTSLCLFFILFVCISCLSIPQGQLITQAETKENHVEEVEEDPIQPYVDEQIEEIGLDEVRAYWNDVVEEYGGFLPESQKGSFLDFVKGEKSFSLKEWLLGALKFLFHELIVNGKLLGSLILLAVFAVVLQTIQNAFEFHAVSKVAYAVTYMVLIILALNSFKVAITYTETAIENMMGFMLALMPLLLALLASAGSITSVAFFHPFIVFLVNTSGLIILKFVLPLLFLSALLHVVSSMTDHYKVTKLANLLRNVAIGTLGVFFAVFLGVISVQGASSAVADGITIRAAKFITGNFVPVVGRMFTDATDTVLSASLLLKNTIGLAGVVILLIMAFFPAVKVLALAFIYHIASAVLQPLGGGPIVESLDMIGKCVLFIFAALAIVSLMFFLAVTIIIGMGNVSFMMR